MTVDELLKVVVCTSVPVSYETCNLAYGTVGSVESSE